jgi:hypothetical protein
MAMFMAMVMNTKVKAQPVTSPGKSLKLNNGTIKPEFSQVI